MVLEDIGTLIFVDILRMLEYPGSPFTGNIINDLVMFFFIPTVFIIIFIYILSGRLLGNPKLKLLLGIAIYMFIIFGGYYPAFAYMTGPYFIFLIFIMGGLLFLSSHFGIRREGGGGGGAGGGGFPAHAAAGTAPGEVLNQYESLLEVVTKDKAELGRLKEESRDNPALDRMLAVQNEAYHDGMKRLKDLEHEVKKMEFGHDIETQLKAMRRRYGVKT